MNAIYHDELPSMLIFSDLEEPGIAEEEKIKNQLRAVDKAVEQKGGGGFLHRCPFRRAADGGAYDAGLTQAPSQRQRGRKDRPCINLQNPRPHHAADGRHS